MPHLLVIDDERIIPAMIDARLRECGWRVTQACTVHGARSVLHNDPPDVLLADQDLDEGSTAPELASAARHAGYSGPILVLAPSFAAAAAPSAGPDGIVPVPKENLHCLWEVLGRYGPVA